MEVGVQEPSDSGVMHHRQSPSESAYEDIICGIMFGPCSESAESGCYHAYNARCNDGQWGLGSTVSFSALSRVSAPKHEECRQPDWQALCEGIAGNRMVRGQHSSTKNEKFRVCATSSYQLERNWH
jgi:hypothetical protein